MNSIGIMQGRLTEPKGRGIQFFPFENWENEFYIAAELGLNEIEFIFDYDRYEENPLYNKKGLNKINQVIKNTGVIVRAVNIDYFMRRPFYKQPVSNYNKLEIENEEFIKRVIESCYEINAEMVDIPLVDNASIQDVREEKTFITFIKSIAREAVIDINFETDFITTKYKSFVEKINCGNVHIIFDSGDRSYLGYDAYTEVKKFNDLIQNVHIKDKQFKGTTLPLGKGSANLKGLFQGLGEINYSKSLILQVGRGKDGDEKNYIN
jgi:sugar phosphate isomerase/epimerase